MADDSSRLMDLLVVELGRHMSADQRDAVLYRAMRIEQREQLPTDIDEIREFAGGALDRAAHVMLGEQIAKEVGEAVQALLEIAEDGLQGEPQAAPPADETRQRRRQRTPVRTVGYGDGSPFAVKRADVLIIDDDRKAVNALRSALDALGYQTLVVSSPADIVRLRRDAPPRLVVANLVHGNIDGFRIADALADHLGTGHKVVLVSDDDELPPPRGHVDRIASKSVPAAVVGIVAELIGAPRQSASPPSSSRPTTPSDGPSSDQT